MIRRGDRLEAFQEWWVSELGLSPASVEKHVTQLRAAERDYGLDLKRFTIGKALRYYSERRRRNAAFGAAYADYKALNAYCDYLFSERPFRKPKGERRPQVYGLEPDELRVVLKHRHPDRETARLWAGVLFLEFTVGWRNGELARVRDQDLDPVRSRIRCAFPLKRGKKRWVPVPLSTWSPRRPLMAYLRRRPPRHPSAGDALFVTRSHGRQRTALARAVTPGTLRKIMAVVSRETGIRVNHVIARHTVAVRLRRSGFDPLDVRDYLGHSKVQETYLEDPMSLETRMRRRPPRDFYQGGIS